MAIITHYKITAKGTVGKRNDFDGSPMAYCVKNFKPGEIPFKVFENSVCIENEITQDFNIMSKTSGDFHVFETPASGVEILVFTLIVASVASLIIISALKPDALSNVELSNNQISPNNTLSDRTNKPRINQRVPDIGGRVKSIPDAIMQEYRLFRNNVEEAIGYYCVGRGDIELTEIKDGKTLISSLQGSSVETYGPNKSPNNSSPDFLIGDPISQSIKISIRSKEVSNLVLPAEDELDLTLDSANVKANFNGYLEDLTGGSSFSSRYKVGQFVLFINVVAGGQPLGANMFYLVTAIDNTSMTLDITVNPIPWAAMSPSQDNIVSGGRVEWAGSSGDLVPYSKWVVLSGINATSHLVNVVAPGGLYFDNGTNRIARDVVYYIQYQLIDDNLLPFGVVTTIAETMTGSDSSQRGKTTLFNTFTSSAIRVRVGKFSNTFSPVPGTQVNKIVWRDLYSFEPIFANDFGDVTTIHTRRVANFETASIQSPELNCIATEKLNVYQGSGVFAPTKTANTQAMQTLIRMSLDNKIGRRTLSELDLDAILSVQTTIESYFGTADAGKFGYTFDSTKTSAQDVITTICNAVFCIPFRIGRVLGVHFEQQQTAPNMVFTHRSKKPKSETWTRRFSDESTNDGIELKYFDEITHLQETYFFPIDRSAVNPKILEIPGITNIQQAAWRSKREYQKILYQKQAVDFVATAEGRFVRPYQIISVVKGSRVRTTDGYIIGQLGLVIELSEEVSFGVGAHSIILKQRSGTTESIIVTAGVDARHVVLATPPVESVYFGEDELKTEFSFGSESRLDGQLVLPVSIDPSEKSYVKIKGVNYDSRYYDFDLIPAV